jgi:hypothetical protein
MLTLLLSLYLAGSAITLAWWCYIAWSTGGGDYFLRCIVALTSTAVWPILLILVVKWLIERSRERPI